MSSEHKDDTAWKVFQLNELMDSLPDKPAHYEEFLRVPSLSCGIYHLAAGSRDMQGPHDEDEVYYVLRGSGRLNVNDDIRDVKAGTLLYVRATEDHSFFEIDEDITLLVFFSSTTESD